MPMIMSMTSLFETHDKLQLVGIVGITLSYIIAIIFNTLNGIGGFSIFKSTIGELSDLYYLDITPAGWAFSIWSLIYIWLGVSVIFYIVIIFKKDKEGLRLYMNPPIIDLIYSFTLTLNFALNTTWVFEWDRQELVTSCAVLVFMAITNLLTIGFIANSISLQNHELKKSNAKLYWCYVMVMNGQGLYGTWTVIAALINLGSTLRYVSMISMVDTSNVCLSLLLVFSLIYFILENTVLDQKLRFLLTPYFVLVWALAAIVAAEVSNPEVQDQTKMFVAGLLSISCVFLILRIILVILRQRTKPIGQDYDNVDSSDPTRSGISTYGSIF